MRVNNNGKDLEGDGKVGLGMMGEVEGVRKSTIMAKTKKEMVRLGWG